MTDIVRLFGSTADGREPIFTTTGTCAETPARTQTPVGRIGSDSNETRSKYATALGRGQVIDAAMVDGAALLTTFLHGMHANGMWEGDRGTNVLDGAAPFYDTYETSDGKYMAVGCVEPEFYAAFLDTLGLQNPELPFQLDASAWPHMKKLIGDTFSQKTRDEWTQIFADSDACVSPVLSPWEAHQHPHNQARGAFVEVDGVLQPAPAPRFSRTQNTRPVPINNGGRDITKTLAAWAFDECVIAQLQKSGTVR